jgi:hypothetical protein
MLIKKKFLNYYKSIIYKIKNKINLDTQVLNLQSLNDLFNYFGTDKGTEVIDPYQKKSTNLDQKFIGHGYGEFYEKYLNIFKDKKINILEIGTWKGASVAAFYHYFKKAIIFCIDKNFKFQFKSNRVNFFKCDTEKFNEVNDFNNYLKGKKIDYFDVIIDDGSHKYQDILNNFQRFFKRIKTGGYYIIEDFKHHKLHPNYANDAPSNSTDIDEILLNLNNKDPFKSTILDYQFQNYCFNKISNIKIHKGIQEFSFIVFIKKK